MSHSSLATSRNPENAADFRASVSASPARKLKRQHCHGEDHSQLSQQAHHAHAHQGELCACAVPQGSPFGEVVKPASSRGILRKQALGFALKAMLKKKGGRTDIEIQDAPKSHHSLMTEVPLKERAGYPLVRDKGSVDPATWRSNDGKDGTGANLAMKFNFLEAKISVNRPLLGYKDG
eukprot:s138_g8.t1